MESILDYSSKESDSKPSMAQVMETTKEKTGYEPGSIEYHEASLEIARQLESQVSETNSDATYEEVMGIDSDAFEMLDEAGGQRGLLNSEHRRRIEEGDLDDTTSLYGLPGDKYDACQAGSKGAKMLAEDSQNPEKNFRIETLDELDAAMRSFQSLMQDIYSGSDYADTAMEKFASGLVNHSQNVEYT